MIKFKLVWIFSLITLMISSCGYQNNNSGEKSIVPKEVDTDIADVVNSETVAPEYNFLSSFDEGILKSYFDSFENATFIIYDENEKMIYNETLSNTELDPYSTFKIPNSIIALETKVVDKENSLKKWDGTIYSREVQNQDHDLASAFENSVLWYYKELAREIGNENMSKYLEIMSYGNKDISGGIDKFWLGSSLKISPMNQVEFLKKFYNNEFGFSTDTVDTVKSIMKQKNTELELYGKSGSSGDGMWWFIGYIMVEDKPYFFATYLEDEEKGLEAKKFTIEMLTDLVGNRK